MSVSFHKFYTLLTLISVLKHIMAYGVCQIPSNFIQDVPIKPVIFENLSKDFKVNGLLEAEPRSANDIIRLSNWAFKNGYRLRPMGAKASWSPIVVQAHGDHQDCKTILINGKHLNHMEMIQNENGHECVQAGSGVLLDTMLDFLAEKGLGFGAIPVNGQITIGGLVATSSHGMGVAGESWKLPSGRSFGSLSNMITALKAIVWNASSEAFEERLYHRTDADIAPLLASLGRIYVTEVTLRVGKEESIRCLSITNLPVSTLFANAKANEIPDNSLSHFVNTAGPLTCIHYPFTDKAWLRVFTPQKQRPLSSRQVTRPYNYLFHDRLPEWIRQLIARLMKGNSRFTPLYSNIARAATLFGLHVTRTMDLWGSSKDIFRFASDRSPPVSVSSFAIITSRPLLQKVLHQAFSVYSAQLESFARRGEFPINGASETRIGAIDNPDDLGIPGAEAPTFSVSAPVQSHPEWDTVIWFDIATFSRTPFVASFIEQLDGEFRRMFNGTDAMVRVEWSKRAYFASENDILRDQWVAKDAIAKIPQAYDGWEDAAKVLHDMDPNGVFRNDMLANILS